MATITDWIPNMREEPKKQSSLFFQYQNQKRHHYYVLLELRVQVVPVGNRKTHIIRHPNDCTIHYSINKTAAATGTAAQQQIFSKSSLYNAKASRAKCLAYYAFYSTTSRFILVGIHIHILIYLMNMR